MDGRDDMALPGSASYYLHRGLNDPNPISGSGGGSGIPIGISASPGFRPLSNPTLSVPSNLVPAFQVQNPSPNFPPGSTVGVTSGGSPSDSGKRKRGRPRKYDLEGAKMSLGLSPLSSVSSPGFVSPYPKRGRGRPRGSGWKQKLAPLGEWMNNSAGQAFTPHIIHIGAGEDISMTLLSFAQRRPRALCILSANGTVSAVTFRQPSDESITFEGHFEILCLSGSYLVADSGGPHNRTGGLSISVCSPDGQVIGGAIGGRLTAASPIQVVVCSFVYEGNRTKAKEEASLKNKDFIVTCTC